ncbi:MAG: hypothetical protein ACLGIS_04360 [Actinomycetes bacterium]|uniref:hypothetical protein n=1 Tax=Pseudarthrobacter phenanthrenivorans TaxID=361575 RepID=UPI0020B7A632|nr:hypothetical protein [Pseudarthrobacter phenanthrenivorans]
MARQSGAGRRETVGNSLLPRSGGRRVSIRAAATFPARAPVFEHRLPAALPQKAGRRLTKRSLQAGPDMARRKTRCSSIPA